jgi:hypothetical protein
VGILTAALAVQGTASRLKAVNKILMGFIVKFWVFCEAI